MQAAQQLIPDEEQARNYINARDISAIKSFYATNWFNTGHTGGGIGEMWHHVAMSMVREKYPTQYRSYFDTRKWFMDLSRRHDGTIGIVGGERYNQSASEHPRAWGTIMALMYTAPRKQLRIFGAPPTEWSHTRSMPIRPWGNEADDVFYLTEPIKDVTGQVKVDISKEHALEDSSLPFLRRVRDADVSDQTLWYYIHHPEYGLRMATMRAVVQHNRTQLILPLLKSKDPRLRHAGLLALTGMFKGRAIGMGQITEEMWREVSKMLDNPNESWWVTRSAMQAMAKSGSDHIAQHFDRLVWMLDHDDWWMRDAAYPAAEKLAGDPKYAGRILPHIASMMVRARDYYTTGGLKKLGKQLQNLSESDQKKVRDLFIEAYEEIPNPIVAPGGHISSGQTALIKGRVAEVIGGLPGGTRAMLMKPKKSMEWQKTKRDEDLYVFNGTFETPEALVGHWKTIDTVDRIENFKFAANLKFFAVPFKQVTLASDGTTNNKMWFWSGNKLIRCDSGEALGMSVKMMKPWGKNKPEPILFIEFGGYSAAHPDDWQPKIIVLQKK
ncbi:MAG: DUF6288 domain-containing protein, partial [Phycisphaeraceae bacterium]|nr:DUF6288 domain-containing protein [Phycisphaeraceae bacterium]